MKYFLIAFLTFVALGASANEAVLFNYVLEEKFGADDVTTSEFGLLVNFDKAASADIGNTAKLEMFAEDLGSKVRVNLTLHDYLNGNLIEIGKGSVDVPFDSQSEIAWFGENNQRYGLSISPSRHKIK